MRVYWFHFSLGVFIAFVALFEFPFPAAFDRWLFTVIGILIALTSFGVLSRARTRVTHESQETD